MKTIYVTKGWGYSYTTSQAEVKRAYNSNWFGVVVPDHIYKSVANQGEIGDLVVPCVGKGALCGDDHIITKKLVVCYDLQWSYNQLESELNRYQCGVAPFKAAYGLSLLTTTKPERFEHKDDADMWEYLCNPQATDLPYGWQRAHNALFAITGKQLSAPSSKGFFDVLRVVKAMYFTK